VRKKSDQRQFQVSNTEYQPHPQTQQPAAPYQQDRQSLFLILRSMIKGGRINSPHRAPHGLPHPASGV
jgi:hypothetical protein